LLRTEAVELVILRVAAQIWELKHQLVIVAEEVERLLDDIPPLQVLMSMPGVLTHRIVQQSPQVAESQQSPLTAVGEPADGPLRMSIHRMRLNHLNSEALGLGER
jgi:hypothetical protein